MLQKVKNRLKDQRGLTLIELLAVIVILGIIAAIAIPSIGGLIDNSRKDAHVANAQQMISSAKLSVSANNDIQPSLGTSTYVSLAFLENENYLETVKDPDGGNYEKGEAAAPDDWNAAPTEGTSYVVITNTDGKFSYKVVLYGSERHIPETAESDLDRSDVDDNTATEG